VLEEKNVHREATHGTLAGELVEANTQVLIDCRHCGSDRVFRVYRQGFLQERIYPILGFYPWKCKVCGANMILRKRRRSKAGQKAYVE
jgi:hypothetical protein